jgi:hypothetical protein
VIAGNIQKSDGVVQEVPGFYGSVKIEEKVIQKIWKEQDFLTKSLFTECGKKIVVIDSGSWNLAEEGPDFMGAVLMIDGVQHHGDVEIHFYPNQWCQHKHHLDPNFEKVLLQVSVFSGNGIIESVHAKNGKPIPNLVLLPHLFQALEEYAEHYALAKLLGPLSDLDHSIAKLRSLSPVEVDQLALKRWHAKIQFARNRLGNQQWSEACHQWFLEILGYKRNKSKMLMVSQMYPLSFWIEQRADPLEIFSSINNWRLKGCRPMNHPRARLLQYAELCSVNPNWTDDMMDLVGSIMQAKGMVGVERKTITNLVKKWKDAVLCGKFAPGKANTIWIDGMLPLLSAYSSTDAFEVWKHWPTGDFPQSWRSIFRETGWTDRSKGKVLSNGMVQALIQFLLEEKDQPSLEK